MKFLIEKLDKFLAKGDTFQFYIQSSYIPVHLNTLFTFAFPLVLVIDNYGQSQRNTTKRTYEMSTGLLQVK